MSNMYWTYHKIFTSRGFFFSMCQCTVINVLVFALQGAFGMLVWILPTFFYYGRCASGGCTNLLDEDAVRIQPLDRYNFLIFNLI